MPKPIPSQLHKIRITPTGRQLHVYMAAILEVTGMDQGRIFPLKKFLLNFKTHLDNARIERTDGGYRLTPKGRDYFCDRYNLGNQQYVERSEVEKMIHGITGCIQSSDWIRLE